MFDPRERDRPDRRFLRRATWTLSLLLLAGSALTALGRVATDRAARGRLVQPGPDAPARPVAIVLGALVHRDGRLSDTVHDRVACAHTLYRTGRVQRILVSGDHRRVAYDEVTAMGAALVSLGVPAERIFLDHAGFRTLDTMQRAREVFGVRSALVCSQRFHLPRALFLAEQSGIDAVGAVSDLRRYRTETFNGLRETLARAAAVVDVLVGRRARLFGPPIDLAGDGRVTHDRPLTAQR